MKVFLHKYRIINAVATLVILGLIGMLYMFVARPYQLQLGATQKEIERSMPGDELDSDPDFLATRAITIEGTPKEIWPWLIQMGYDRAGFYGYDILENLGSEQGLQSAEQILPEFQHFEVGDVVPISAIAELEFYAIEPDEYVIWKGDGEETAGGFTWALYPLDENHTRLVSRIRWNHQLDGPGSMVISLFTELTDHIAVRKILQGVKGRVEGQIESMVWQNIEFFLFVAAFCVFLFAIFRVLIHPLTWKNWFIGLGGGIVWLLIWYAPIPIWLGMLFIFLILWSMRRESGR